MIMSDFLLCGQVLKKFNVVICVVSIVVVCYFFFEIIGVWMNLVLVIVQMFVFCIRKEVIYEYLFVFWFGLILGILVVIQMNMLLLRLVLLQKKDKKKNKWWNGKELFGKNSKNERMKFVKEFKKRYIGNV